MAMNSDLIEDTKPCPDPYCIEGWNYDRDWWCQTCKGRAEIEIEVCPVCRKVENECDGSCFESEETKAA